LATPVQDLPADLQLRELEPDDQVTGLSLGDARFTPLKIFLQKHAKDYHAKNIAKSYVLVDPAGRKVWGYVSLVCSQIEVSLNGHPEDVEGYSYSEYPSVKIVRLAIDKRLGGRQLGTQLVHWAISVSKNKIMPFVGCRFLVVDSKPTAIEFYEKCGFTLLDTPDNKVTKHPLLFVDLQKI
jgi:GNAT superfamily N-acetyltransferase